MMDYKVKIATDFFESHKHLVKTGFIFSTISNRNSWKIVPPKTKGVYWYTCASTGVNVYVGETMNCMISRGQRHVASIKDPEWGGECSGKKICELGMKTETFQMYYFDAFDLGIKSKRDNLFYETLVTAYLKPLVYLENQ